MNKVNRERRKRLHEKQFGDYAHAIRLLPCLALGQSCSGPVQAHHVSSRGAGGSQKDMVPLCAAHHALLHSMGKGSFGHRFMVDLEAESAALWEEWCGGGEHREAVTGSLSEDLGDP